jgi:hypothetical protein
MPGIGGGANQSERTWSGKKGENMNFAGSEIIIR